jgi:hypothetical protein
MKIPMHHTLSRLKKGILTSTVAILSLQQLAHTATAADPDKTPENVQKKAVIVKHHAKLFKKSSNDEGDEAKFMQIYFMMKPSIGDRVPVSRSANRKGKPDGWLQKGAYMEWNTLQMIKLEPQSGRKLAKVFDNQSCAEMFGKDGEDAAGCKEIGAEPNRFTSKTEPQLLIPVFEKQKNSYQGGFIRVYEKGSAVKAASSTTAKNTAPQGGTVGTLGYDIVFAVDSTGSMGEYFIPTTEVLQSFIKHIKEATKDDELKMPLLIGLLFYKDRLSYRRCDHSFPITEWKQELTEDIDSVIEALTSAKKETCSSEDSPEAVLDGLNRVLVDTKWQDNHFKAIVLVGDAGPHPENHDKNPMNFTVTAIINAAEQKKIRFLTFKLGDDEKAFKELAFAVKDEQNKGRYKAIPTGSEFKKNLLDAMTQEWAMLTKAQQVIKGGDNRAALSNTQVQQKYDLTPYEALIIQARLPDTVSASHPASQAIPEFVKGWIPKEIKNDLVLSEFLFMGKSRLTILASTLESIAEAASIGLDEGGDAFIEVIRSVLAAQLKVSPSQLFGQGETLNSILKKANILPFKTQVLSFTAQEITTWKPEDYERVHTILKEKVKVLREFKGNPTNNRYFGSKPHLYVPRAFFP